MKRLFLITSILFIGMILSVADYIVSGGTEEAYVNPEYYADTLTDNDDDRGEAWDATDSRDDNNGISGARPRMPERPAMKRTVTTTTSHVLRTSHYYRAAGHDSAAYSVMAYTAAREVWHKSHALKTKEQTPWRCAEPCDYYVYALMKLRL